VGRLSLDLILGTGLLLYQMPKTGSQTVEETVHYYSPNLRLFRVHFLSMQNAGMVRQYINKKGVDAGWKRDAQLQAELLVSCSRSLRARKFLVRCGLPLPKLKVVTAVREIVGAALSSLFENYRLFVPQPELFTVEQCRELLLKPAYSPQFYNWFDDELHPFCGVNVFSSPFSPEQGYAVYTTRYARVLLYRFENFPVLTPALEHFLGCQIPSLVNRNIGSAKDYADHYRNVKTLLKLPAPFVQQLFSTQMMRHFYSAAELERLAEQWQESASSNASAARPSFAAMESRGQT